MAKHAHLTAFDRCDHGQCGAQAYVRVMFASSELLFCAHHYAQHVTAIEALNPAPQIQDERARLTETAKLDVSA